jgi:hypothetical protein
MWSASLVATVPCAANISLLVHLCLTAVRSPLTALMETEEMSSAITLLYSSPDTSILILFKHIEAFLARVQRFIEAPPCRIAPRSISIEPAKYSLIGSGVLRFYHNPALCFLLVGPLRHRSRSGLCCLRVAVLWPGSICPPLPPVV